MQFLNTLNYEKVMNMPHVITVNNKKAKITIGEERFVRDEGVGNHGGTVTATKKWVPATLTIEVTPRIAYGVEADKLSLDIKVDIDDFSSSNITDANKVTRQFATTAILNSGEVIAIGGLSRLDDINSLNQTPILGQIPIIGNLFRRRRKRMPKTNLTVFIRPTIVQPKLRGGVGDYTRDYIKLTKQYTQEGMLFDSLKDPITRWLFKPESKVEEAIDDFVRRDELKTDLIYENKLAEQMQQDQEMHMYESQYGPGKKPCVGCPDKKKERAKSKPKPKSKSCRSCIAYDDSKDKLEYLLEDEENPFSAPAA